ncbi:hypothetical protein M0638_13985 [Roseomonas sp. NAR14]|uniref:Uncharacterized protein n=1 Tax=Roseomonas acroporae TaxID=2937791 RepID=A0A9X1YAS2_9PROT|nr:hypothetical protein [Roseomonas acroporae]MCK8785495.1 hypothetical protein [Roseomonas acroporae]
MMVAQIQGVIAGPLADWRQGPGARPSWEGRLRRSARRVGRLLLNLLMLALCSTTLLSLLVVAYSVKRALGLDLIPGVDMLPDEAIEALLWGGSGS